MNKINISQTSSQFNTKKGIFPIDRRKHPRYNIDLPIDYSRIAGKEIHGGILTNISEGGLLAYLSQRMEIGAVLRIEILATQGLELNTIQAIAKVVWMDLDKQRAFGEYRYGLQFLYIDEKDFYKLKNLLKILKG